MPTGSQFESLRLFVAIEIPSDVRTAIQQLQANCRAGLPGRGIRWNDPQHFHLTLRFLGNVESSRVPELTSGLCRACLNFGSLPLQCAGVGMFPERGRPRVVWVGVDDTRKELGRLHAVVADATRGLAAEDVKKHFSGHITLGRCREIGRPESAALRQFVRDFSDRRFGAWEAAEILLMRSELLPQGPVHSVLERIAIA